MFDGSKNLFTNVHWKYFSALEGIFRVVNLVVLKSIAKYLVTPVLGFFIVGILGLIRLVAGLLLTIRSGFAIYPNQKAVTGSLLVGLVTSYTTLIPIYVFVVADVSVLTFTLVIISTLVPSTLINKFSSRGKLDLWQIAALIFTVFGLWALVDFKVINEIPFWGYLLITLPIVVLAKEYFVRGMGTAAVISPWVHNIWVGISMILFSFVTLVVFNLEILSGVGLDNFGQYVWLVILSGILYIAIIFSRQKSFRVMGGNFSRKKFVMIVFATITAVLVHVFVPGYLNVTTTVTAGTAILLGYITASGLIIDRS